jgi:hypothetical protein
MKWLSAGLIFINLSTVCGLLLGMAGHGLNEVSAIFALVAGGAFAVAAWLGAFDPSKPFSKAGALSPFPGSASEAVSLRRAESEVRLSKRAQRRLQKNVQESIPAPRCYGKIWLWLLGACFLMFAVRSFCWLLYIDDEQLNIQSPNNLGDLALHITLIRNFASGVALWPDNPIYVFSKLKYPAGMDLFNALLYLVHVDLIRGLVWAGLLASLATFYAFFRWGGAFGVAGFLFNGGITGFEFFKALRFLDYQGDKAIAWKSIALSMFVTQRGLLYAIPAGLLLLWHWREKFWSADPVVGRLRNDSGRAAVLGSGPLPFWVELSIYASMPLFNVHAFLALSAVLVFLFACGDAEIRKHVAILIAIAFLPATFFVWLISDNFRAASMIKWDPGWVMHDFDFSRANMFQFWFVNFGIFIPLALYLVGICGWRAWKTGIKWNQKLPLEIAFILPALAIFIAGLLFQFASWDWDNLKLMIWAYFLVLPFLWKDLIQSWSVPVRVGVCIALFGSGFITLFGGLAAGRPGFALANRAELDAVGAAVRRMPVEARFAAYPTYNHPLLLQGRKVVMGYPGHLWTEGFDDYAETQNRLRRMMEGTGNWREIAHSLGVRYIFWGREETANYQASKRPWETTALLVASGPWGAIYDLGLSTAEPRHK